MTSIYNAIYLPSSKCAIQNITRLHLQCNFNYGFKQRLPILFLIIPFDFKVNKRWINIGILIVYKSKDKSNKNLFLTRRFIMKLRVLNAPFRRNSLLHLMAKICNGFLERKNCTSFCIQQNFNYIDIDDFLLYQFFCFFFFLVESVVHDY